jgi:hypothetical protein
METVTVHLECTLSIGDILRLSCVIHETDYVTCQLVVVVPSNMCTLCS